MRQLEQKRVSLRKTISVLQTNVCAFYIKTCITLYILLTFYIINVKLYF